jgi:hypothetical protein
LYLGKHERMNFLPFGNTGLWKSISTEIKLTCLFFVKVYYCFLRNFLSDVAQIGECMFLRNLNYLLSKLKQKFSHHEKVKTCNLIEGVYQSKCVYFILFLLIVCCKRFTTVSWSSTNTLFFLLKNTPLKKYTNNVLFFLKTNFPVFFILILNHLHQMCWCYALFL